VVHQAHNRTHAKLAQSLEAAVGPFPPGAIGAGGGDPLPQDGKANGGDTGIGEKVEVVGEVGMDTVLELVEKGVLDPVNCALEPRP
jgi:hypothetical protein